MKTIYRSWWSFYDHEIHKHELFPYSFSMNWPYPARKNEVKSHFTYWPRLLQWSRYWTAKSNLYFEISQLLSLSSLASLVKRPKQLSLFPHASVRKTSFCSMNLYLDYLLSWQCEPELKLSRLLIRSLLSALCNFITVHKWLGNCLNMYKSIILLLQFITSTKFTFKTSTLR